MLPEAVAGELRGLTPLVDNVLSHLVPSYELQLGESPVQLNDYLGCGVKLTYLDQLQCSECAKRVRKLYNRSYCYDCFRQLARCDLCFVSPERCHFHLGTCREPQWGEAYCMQPHSIYLASTSSAKIGITSAGREHRRWLDQGAWQALKIADAPSRRAAGVVEAYFKRYINDRTDWRKLVTGRREEADLHALALTLQAKLPVFAALDQSIVPPLEMQTLTWAVDAQVTAIDFPVQRFSPATRLILSGDNLEICDNLQGVIGQYLLLSKGVINLADYQGAAVNVELGAPFDIPTGPDTDQLSLF